jgi:hypothetical protein
MAKLYRYLLGCLHYYLQLFRTEISILETKKAQGGWSSSTVEKRVVLVRKDLYHGTWFTRMGIESNRSVLCPLTLIATPVFCFQYSDEAVSRSRIELCEHCISGIPGSHSSRQLGL